MQKIFLQGRLVSDAAVRQYNGRTFLSFTLACNQKRKNEEVPTYYNVTWNNYAEGLVQYLTQGKPLTVVGNIFVSTEVSPKDGKTYPRIDVRAESVDFIPFGASGNTNTVKENAAPAAPSTMPQPEAVAQPVYQQPVAQPMAQPVYAPQPAPQPVYQQPMAQPTYAPQPTPQPVAQPAYVTGMPDPTDDLPF